MKSILFVHRARNTKADYLGSLLTEKTFVFDYRGTNTLQMLRNAFSASLRMPRADIYLVEGGLCYWPVLFRKIIQPRAHIILMAPEPVFNWRVRSATKNLFLKILFSPVEYLLPIAELVAQDAKHYMDRPYTVVHQFLEEAYLNASQIIPGYTAKHLLFSASRPKETGWTKGLDIAVNIFEKIYEKDPEFHLYIIGRGTEELDYSNLRSAGNIHLDGFQDPREYAKLCPIILAPARYDALNVAIIEASAMGQIPLLSPTTGAEEFVKKADAELVIDHREAEKYARKILELFDLPISDRVKLSDKLRALAAEYSKENAKSAMERAREDMARRFGWW